MGNKVFGNSAIFRLSNLTSFESLDIGDSKFSSVKTFQLNGLNKLKRLKIGRNSFTQEEDNHGSDITKSFHILNCEELESIEIGEYSFSDFGGDFELKNLNSLQSIKIGNNESEIDSYNFYNGSFIIESKKLCSILID